MIEKLLLLMGEMEETFPGKDRLSKLVQEEHAPEEMTLDELSQVAAAALVPPFVPDKKAKE